MRGRFLLRRNFPFIGHCLYVAFYTRRLPHWQPPDADFFVTWRLYGSLPAFKMAVPESISVGAAFVAMDKELDHATTGPM